MNKKIKFILFTFVSLILALSFNSVFASEADLNSEKQFLSYLEINKDITSPDDARITRAEFAYMVARMANLDTNVSSDGGFSDVEGHRYQKEINTLKKYGITSGTAENIYTPEGNVSVSAAAKLVVAALELDKIAEASGGYPYGYLKIANNADLFKGVSTDDDILTVGESYIVIYNALVADKGVMEGIYGDDVIYGTGNGKNLLTENFGLEQKKGTVTSVGLVGVNETKADKGKIGIDYELFDTNISMDNFFGLEVSVWYKEQDKKIYAVSIADGAHFKDLNAYDISGYENYVVSYYDENGKEVKYKLDKAFTYMLNGRASVFDKNSLVFKDGTVRLIDTDGNGQYDFVHARKLKYFVISSIDSIKNVIYDSKSELKMLDLADDNTKEYTIEADGKMADFESLSVGMVLSVVMSEDKTICNIYASTQVLETTLEELSQDKLILKGKEYATNTYFDANYTALKVGGDYVFSLAHDGTVTSAQIAGTGSYKYGIVLGFRDGSGKAFETPAIKLMDETGAISGFELNKKIRLNGVSVNNTDTSIRDLLLSGDAVKYQLVKYSLTDGMLSKLDTENQTLTSWDFETAKSEDDSLTKYMNNTQVFYRSGRYTYGTPGVSFKGALIFRVPTNYDTVGESFGDESFSIVSLGEIKDESEPYVDVYDFDDTMTPKVILYRENATSTSVKYPGYQARTYVVTGVSNAVDPDGEEAILIRAFSDSNYEELYVKPDMYAQFAQTPTPGDCIRITTDLKGYVTGLRVDVDYEFLNNNHEFTPYYDNDGVNDDITTGVNNMAHAHITYYTGEVYISKNDALTIKVIDNPPKGYWKETPGRILRLGSSNPVYLEYNVTSGKARKITSADIIGYKEAGEGNGSVVVCRTEYGCVQTVIVYTK